MSLYSSRYLKNLSSETLSSVKNRLIAESRTQHTAFDIFLSHSYLDKDEVEGIYIELRQKGYSVYVDWIIDPHLSRDNVTKEAAETIRKRLKASKSLLLAVSTNAGLSKWIPWELGFVDGLTGQCALFPVSRDINPPKTFERSEYLKLYPYVKNAELTTYSPDLFITESANSYVAIRDWVRSREKPSYKYKNIDLL
ncbi:MAG: toll/interleukin-1 receptor domain-containing protein [Chitinophagaceae bacterium]